MRWQSAIATCLVAIMVTVCPAGEPDVQESSSSGAARHALLVGVTHYPYIERFDLRGPANDVEIMEQLLRERFDVPAESIVVLSEPRGADDERWLPTRANIERQFRHLAETAGPGDEVVIFLAGHGSQQPQPEDPDDWELDGMDEIFLPRDVRRWDDDLGAIPNAIVDNEFGRWLAAIQARQASVWIVFDSCHSGTMIRGADELVRQVPSDRAGLGIPDEAIAAARRRAEERIGALPERARGEVQRSSPLGRFDEAGIVAIYACQPHEVTIERNFPRFAADARPYGLLTYTLCQILSQSARPMTYDELVRRIFDEYAAMGRRSPVPVVEGTDRSREVLGQRTTRQPPIAISQRGGQLVVDAGSLHGLTPGSILSVFDPEDPDALLGHVEVAAVRVHEATVVPREYDNLAAPNARQLTGRWCQLVFADYGELRLPVAIDPEATGGEPVPGAQRERLSRKLQSLEADPQSLVRQVDDPADAQWLVRGDGRQVYLVPAAEWSRGRMTNEPAVEESLSEALGPVADEQAEAWLDDALTRIARAENLKRLAVASSDPLRRAMAATGVEIDVEVRAHDGPDDELGAPVTWPERDRIRFRDGDRLTVWLRNPGRVPADVTLLYVDSRYGITPLFPELGEYNRLMPGDSLPLGLVAQATTTGLEHLVVIAVRGEGPPVDFASLAQPTIEQARGEAQTRGAPTARALDSPLGQLLQRGLYGQGERAAARQRETLDYALQHFAWYVQDAVGSDGELGR